MGGRCELGEIVFTPVSGMLKAMVSAPEYSLASWMAALSVHGVRNVELVSQMPLPGSMSEKSCVELTVKVLAWAGLAASSRPSITASPAANTVALLARIAPE